MSLPSGTVTFLFTDIEGSTLLLRQLGDRYGAVLDEHRRLLRAAFEAADGHEVDTEGDAFFVAFSRAGDAVRAAAAAQRALSDGPWPDGVELRVRMGVHTGEPILAGDRYVGIDVHRAARIAAAAHGGQVVLSQTTRELIAEVVVLDDLGQHRLKDLAEPQQLYQLVIEGLRRRFPPLRTLADRPNNLPLQPTPLIGRARELDAVCGLLRRDEVRLVTLTGAGGTGKTRLALRAAADLLGEFEHGVFFVPLAPIVDPTLVVPAVGQAFGFGAMQTLDGYLAEKRLLLVLDNFEQILAGAAGVAELIAKAPNLNVLVTSRAPLRLSGEHVYPVPPLPEREAVTLFFERAQAVRRDFELTDENEPAVYEICRRLDGLPLAVELAAARILVLSPQAMLARLSQRLQLLTGGARDLPERQQTLRDTIAWSHDLLNDQERGLFAHLAVFAGGFTLQTAETVCHADLETLASLVEKSLLRHDADRFSMLQTIREYAADRLAVSGGNATLRQRHADYFLAWSEQMYPLRWEREKEFADRLEQEHDNLRAALDWLRDANPEQHLRLTGALGWFWRVHTHLAEGRERLADALNHYPGEGVVRARALLAAGELAAWSGDRGPALVYLDEAERLFRKIDDLQEVAFVIENRSWAHFLVGDVEAVGNMKQSLELQKQIGNAYLVNRAEVNLLQVLISTEAVDLVEPRCAQILAAAEALGDLRSVHYVHHFYSDCALMRGDCEASEQRYRVALESAIPLGDILEIAAEVQGVALSAAGRSRPVRALRLAAASSKRLDEAGIDISGIAFWARLVDRYLGLARDELGPEASEAAWQEGRNMDWDAAVQSALDLAPD